MTRPEVTREDFRRIIREYMMAHPPDDMDKDELEEFAEKRNFDAGVWDDVMGMAMTSGRVFFSLLIEQEAQGMPEDELVPVDVEKLVSQVCGSVAATFFMLGWEVSEQVGGGDA